MIIPVIQETAEVTKRVVDRGALRVTKIVSESEEVIPTPTESEEVEIEHVARNVWLKKPASVRRKGDVLIIPVMEEVTVVEKRLFLREEVFIRKRKVKVPGQTRVTLRHEAIQVEDSRTRVKKPR